MLRFLAIRNLAVIESVEVEFDGRLSVLTGETGAGKSILVGGGGPAARRPRVPRPGPDRGGHGDDPGDVRRPRRRRTARSPGGDRAGTKPRVRQRRTRDGRRAPRSRRQAGRPARPARAPGAARPGHASRSPRPIRRPRCRTRTGRGARSPEYQAAVSALDEVRALSAQRASRLEIAEFHLAEIARAKPQPGEDEELASLRTLLSSAERVRRLAEESYAILYDRDEAVLASLGQVWKRVGELASLDARFAPIPRGARRREVAARGPGVLSPRLLGEHRRVARAAPAGRGPARAARAPEEEARADAGRRREEAVRARTGSGRPRLALRADRRPRRPTSPRAPAPTWRLPRPCPSIAGPPRSSSRRPLSGN